MTIVRNRLQRPGVEAAQARTKVSIRLRPSPGFYPPNVLLDYQIAGTLRPNVDSDGSWQADLVPNDDVTAPADSFYEVREQVDDMVALWPFKVPGPIAFTDGHRDTNVVTLEGVATGHGVQAGDVITVDAADAGYDGTFTASGSTANQVLFPQTGADDVSSGAGTITKTWDLVELIDLFTPVMWGGEPVLWEGLSVLWSEFSQPDTEPLLVQVASTVTSPGGASDPTAVALWNRVRLDLRLRGGGFYGAPDQSEILGSARILPDSTGDWVRQLVPNTAIVPSGSYYELRQQAGEEIAVFKFRVPAAWNVVDSQRVSNVVTLTVDRPVDGLGLLDVLIVDLADPAWDGTFFVSTAVGNTITYSQFAADDPDGGTGTANKTWSLSDLVAGFSL